MTAIPTCKCGHPEGDHAGTGARVVCLNPLTPAKPYGRSGVCFVRGCRCREFRRAS